ncbi:tetratricopeptide repeat protein [Arcobacter vandammei]|uniref:tetratricopeptide repeat protein n=1 Tax=Arcobacter vandammei TaxID=2782243 RepID=UPI0018DF6D7A|nr:hypothetical protein [Arcobacter vandammei]
MKILLGLFIFLNLLNAQKDFYYSFIDSNGKQISEETKQTIRDGFDILENIRYLSRNDKIEEAFTQIKELKEKNKLKILTSDIIVLYSELALKKDNKRLLLDASDELEKAINSSQINEADLPHAYMLLVDLKLSVNKIDNAKYFAQIIIDNFDNNFTKTYGKIALAKVFKYQKDYGRSASYLYEILSTTKDKTIATLVADELFDVYVLSGDMKKANELISQVLKTNVEFYAVDTYLANKKINKLLKANMPEHASEILIELLNTTTQEEQIEDYKYKLANTYMRMYDKTNYYLEKAKELYKEIINDYENGLYSKNSAMYLDEILMRQGVIAPNVIAQKYEDSEEMQQKALLQELMIDKRDKKYENILKTQAVYKKISNEIAKRFGYKNMDEIFSEIDLEIIKDKIQRGECSELSTILQNAKNETFEKIIEDETLKYSFFECLVETSNDKTFYQLKDIFNTSKDANIYLYLEKMALSLDKLDEAFDFSAKVEMLNDKKALANEFIIRYQINKAKDNPNFMEKFFIYANYNPEYIKQSENSPALIDFYHDYYLYLTSKNKIKEANDILEKLYFKQKDFKAFVYSPFVEMELARISKENDNKNRALELLLGALENARKILPNDEVKIYYDILSLYDNLGNKSKKEEYLKKCKKVENTQDSLYKKMCDEMK